MLGYPILQLNVGIEGFVGVSVGIRELDVYVCIERGMKEDELMAPRFHHFYYHSGMLGGLSAYIVAALETLCFWSNVHTDYFWELGWKSLTYMTRSTFSREPDVYH